MRSLEELLVVAEDVRTDIASKAIGSKEVPERLVVVTDGTATVLHLDGHDTFGAGDVVAFVNDSGVPFVEQAPDLVSRASELKPQAVLLGGTAVLGGPGTEFRRILAVQLCSARPAVRTAWISEVTDAPDRTIRSIGPWRETKAGPPIWADEILTRAGW